MASGQRIYVVTDKQMNKRLILAAVRSQAISHVAKSEYQVNVASQTELVDLIQQGVQVEAFKE